MLQSVLPPKVQIIMYITEIIATSCDVKWKVRNINQELVEKKKEFKNKKDTKTKKGKGIKKNTVGSSLEEAAAIIINE